jgi:hypothetical protein
LNVLKCLLSIIEEFDKGIESVISKKSYREMFALIKLNSPYPLKLAACRGIRYLAKAPNKILKSKLMEEESEVVESLLFSLLRGDERAEIKVEVCSAMCNFSVDFPTFFIEIPDILQGLHAFITAPEDNEHGKELKYVAMKIIKNLIFGNES